MSEETIRTFIALEISDEIKQEIARIQDEIRQTNAISGKWVVKENLHLTLKFLGDTTLKIIEQIKEEIKTILYDEPSMNCNIAGVGVFPNEKFARVIWVGIKGGDTQIINLAKKFEKQLGKLGFKKEKKDFKTHITICRPKQILDKNQFKSTLETINNKFQPKEFIVNKLTFFESKLTPQGPLYTSLCSVLLK